MLKISNQWEHAVEHKDLYLVLCGELNGKKPPPHQMRMYVSAQFSSVIQSCPTLCDPLSHSTPGLPVHHQLPESTQTHVHWVSDAIQPSHPLSSPFPPAPNPSQHQGLFQWVSFPHQVAKVLEFQLQHQSGHMYTCDWFTLPYSRNWHSSVKQLYSI